MKKELKKDIFILLLNNLFDDKTNDINKSNCIPFYHFLINTLEDEIHAIPENEDADISLCHSLIYLLCKFDVVNHDIEDWSTKSINKYIIDYSGLSNEEFKPSIFKFKKIYFLIKNEFLMDLT